MTRIKICGITNEEDARAAVDYGADALGFIAVKDSPRYVSTQQFQRISADIAWPLIARVVVVRKLEDSCDYRCYVQYYEEPEPAPCEGWWPDPWRLIRAFRIRNEESLHEIAVYKHGEGRAAYLLDTYHQGKLGGSGETFNWELAVEAKRISNKPIILAGGLTPENVGEAVARVRPYAVDVSSGVEAEPGRKDYDKLRRFIRAVRQADLALDE